MKVTGSLEPLCGSAQGCLGQNQCPPSPAFMCVALLTRGAHHGDIGFDALQVVSMPEVSGAFEEFSRKALCQESLAFLKDVST